MKDLEVGMYIRTHKGHIYKISMIEDGYVYVVGFEGFVLFEDISKASYNIIDLIEEGDYVNGCAVIDKPYSYHDIKFISVDTEESWSYGRGEMPCSEIKSILTKEQFKNMAYKVEE